MLFPVQLLDEWRSPEAALATGGDPHAPPLSAPFRAALACTGSLTRHLERTLGWPVGVRLEYQELRPAWDSRLDCWDGHQALPPGDQDVLVREAWLEVDGRDRVLAHSEMMLEGLSAAKRQAIEAGQVPLGALFLEWDGGVTRQQLELSRCRNPALAARLGRPADHPFWCRRSLFHSGGRLRARILELFLEPF
ncbi:MAG: DUF98 domain-containing protein [Magnetococcales bacterium]|nr:DUF98 domain-containing protein [Magnetococcales bacterium]